MLLRCLGLVVVDNVNRSEIERLAKQIQGLSHTGDRFSVDTRYDCPICAPKRTGKNLKKTLHFDSPEYVEKRGYLNKYVCSECGHIKYIGQHPTPMPVLLDIVRLKLELYSTRAIAQYVSNKHGWVITEQAIAKMLRKSSKLHSLGTQRFREVRE